MHRRDAGWSMLPLYGPTIPLHEVELEYIFAFEQSFSRVLDDTNSPDEDCIMNWNILYVEIGLNGMKSISGRNV